MNNKKNKIELELNQERKEIFARAIKEAEKLRKSKNKQDTSCGKVVCCINQDKKSKSK